MYSRMMTILLPTGRPKEALRFVVVALAAFVLCDGLGDGAMRDVAVDCTARRSGQHRRATIEGRARISPLVLHTLAVYTNPSNVSETMSDQTTLYAAHFWLIGVYKGAQEMAKYFQIQDTDDIAVYNVHDRKINVSEFYRPITSSSSLCWKPVTSQKYYILFAAFRDNVLVAFNDDTLGAFEEWSAEKEALVWRGLGWDTWTDWAACTATCGEGIQERWRVCFDPPCAGHNKERRRCNMFPCQGTIEPLATDSRKYFHPSRSLWEKVPDRKSAWRIKPSYYLWLPATQVAFPVADFQKHFALIVSIRVDPTIRTEGTVFSLRSRSQPNTFLSLNMDGPEVLRLIQSTPNKTQSVAIPAAIADGHWHQLALGIQDNVSVRSYLDCRWVSTDILRNNSLADTNDADLVIGYLFTGDLEHLILVPDSGAVVQQCSTTTISLLDRTLLEKSPQSTKLFSTENNSAQLRRRHYPIISDNSILTDLNIKTVITTPIIDVFDGSKNLKETMIDDEDNSLIDGSGDEPVFEVEWSDWSECSVSCGIGIQTRHLQCVNLIRKTRPCPILETDHVEQRSCKVEWCKIKSKYIKNHKKKMLHKTNDFFANTYSVHEDKFTVFRKHHIHEEDLQDTKACKCLNGGTCDEYQTCKCPEQFTGNVCEIEKQNSCIKDCQHGGICLNNKCICMQGYTGDDCSSEICDLNCEPGEVCPPATTCDCHGTMKLKCYNNTSCKPCLNGGECVKNKCKCLPGWSGSDCSIALCKPACKNGGYCIKPNECLCRPGTTGNFCESDTCGSGCLNDGVCVGNSICKCPPNVTGTMCETVLCDPPCEDGATCTTNNICLCTPQMSSPRCAEKKCHYKAVRKPFNVGVRRLAKRKYSSQCKRNVAQCATRLVPKFQTMYRTLYRTVYECMENNTITNFLS